MEKNLKTGIVAMSVLLAFASCTKEAITPAITYTQDLTGLSDEELLKRATIVIDCTAPYASKAATKSTFSEADGDGLGLDWENNKFEHGATGAMYDSKGKLLDVGKTIITSTSRKIIFLTYPDEKGTNIYAIGDNEDKDGNSEWTWASTESAMKNTKIPVSPTIGYMRSSMSKTWKKGDPTTITDAFKKFFDYGEIIIKLKDLEEYAEETTPYEITDISVSGAPVKYNPFSGTTEKGIGDYATAEQTDAWTAANTENDISEYQNNEISLWIPINQKVKICLSVGEKPESSKSGYNLFGTYTKEFTFTSDYDGKNIFFDTTNETIAADGTEDDLAQEWKLEKREDTRIGNSSAPYIVVKKGNTSITAGVGPATDSNPVYPSKGNGNGNFSYILCVVPNTSIPEGKVFFYYPDASGTKVDAHNGGNLPARKRTQVSPPPVCNSSYMGWGQKVNFKYIDATTNDTIPYTSHVWVGNAVKSISIAYFPISSVVPTSTVANTAFPASAQNITSSTSITTKYEDTTNGGASYNTNLWFATTITFANDSTVTLNPSKQQIIAKNSKLVNAYAWTLTDTKGNSAATATKAGVMTYYGEKYMYITPGSMDENGPDVDENVSINHVGKYSINFVTNLPYVNGNEYDLAGHTVSIPYYRDAVVNSAYYCKVNNGVDSNIYSTEQLLDENQVVLFNDFATAENSTNAQITCKKYYYYSGVVSAAPTITTEVLSSTSQVLAARTAITTACKTNTKLNTYYGIGHVSYSNGFNVSSGKISVKIGYNESTTSSVTEGTSFLKGNNLYVQKYVLSTSGMEDLTFYTAVYLLPVEWVSGSTYWVYAETGRTQAILLGYCDQFGTANGYHYTTNYMMVPSTTGVMVSGPLTTENGIAGATYTIYRYTYGDEAGSEITDQKGARPTFKVPTSGFYTAILNGKQILNYETY